MNKEKIREEMKDASVDFPETFEVHREVIEKIDEQRRRLQNITFSYDPHTGNDPFIREVGRLEGMLEISVGIWAGEDDD